MDGATYFLKFRVATGQLSMAERLLVLEHLKSGVGRFYQLMGSVVMPDHGHAILKPNNGVELNRIMKGIKGVSARLINQARRTSGPVWQDESFDRILRDHEEFEEKLDYLVGNAHKAGLVGDPWDYEALYVAQGS
jgi:hypothetical protein